MFGEISGPLVLAYNWGVSQRNMERHEIKLTVKEILCIKLVKEREKETLNVWGNF